MFKSICIAIPLFISSAAWAQPAPAMPTLNDSEIEKVLMIVNEGEIKAGEIAESKAQNKEVKDFAKMMVKDHKQNKEDTKTLAKKIDEKPKDSATCKSLMDEAKASNKELKGKDKMAFDKAYIDEQVTMHQKALALFSDTLIPQAKKPELKEHLEKTRGAVQAHLDHAKKLQASL